MAQALETTAPSAPPVEHIEEIHGDLVISPSDIAGRVWRTFISMRTGLVLILALAVLTLAGTLLAQAPAGIRDDPEAYAQWLEAIRTKYGGWTGFIDKVGLFSVFTSVWFRAIVALLTTSILACSVNRAPRLWKRATRPRIRMTAAFYEHAPLRDRLTARMAPDAAAEAVRGAFHKRRYRTVVERDGDGVHVYADRFRWGPFGTVIAHLSLVVILIGAVAGVTWGFRNEGFAVTVGSTAEVGNGTGLSVKAVSFSDSYYPNGAPSDYATDVVLYSDGTPVRRQTVRVNQPLRYEGVAFFQSFFGAAAVMRVKDQKGDVVFNEGVPLLFGTDDNRRRVGRFSLPDSGLTGFVIGAASGEVDAAIKAGQMQVEIYRDGIEAPIATTIVSQGRPTTIAGLDVTFLRERQFTGLIVARDPGAIFIWIGVALLVAGITLVFFFQNRRVWAHVVPARGGSEIHLGAAPRRDLAFAPDFQHLVQDMKFAVNRRASAT